MARISSERFIRVCDDDHGWFVQVGCDRDSLDLCELIYCEDGQPTMADKGMTLPWEHAEAVAKAILELAALRRAAEA